jgi:hypothetical protein
LKQTRDIESQCLTEFKQEQPYKTTVTQSKNPISPNSPARLEKNTRKKSPLVAITICGIVIIGIVIGVVLLKSGSQSPATSSNPPGSNPSALNYITSQTQTSTPVQLTSKPIQAQITTPVTTTPKNHGNPIAFGQEVTGQITFKGDYQDWKFSGQVGDIITIHMVQDGGASLNTDVDLLDPSGTRLNVPKDGGFTEVWIKNYSLPFSGTYTIRALSPDIYPSVGGYRLSLNKKN